MTEAGLDATRAPLIARTRRIEDAGDLLSFMPRAGALAWIHHGDGIVGWGTAAQIRVDGPDRFAAAEQWWHEISARGIVRDEVDLPGSGLVAFGSFTFGDHSDGSLLVVPEVIVGRRDGVSWVTVIGTAIGSEPVIEPAANPTSPNCVEFVDADVDQGAWTSVVAAAVRRIQAGALDKVVLARAVDAVLDEPLDARAPLARLAASYPGCWTFHVDGFFGATPEMLVRLERGLVTSRVLAGTIRRTGDDARDLTLAASLARSSKDLEEHEYAVRSVADALTPHCSSTNVPESPYVLHLPNVMHLATDVAAVINDDATALTLAAALHPSAAVGGTPTQNAVALIAEIEGLDRGRYAGPVGWIDASGDGEWGIGLRSAQVSGDARTVRLFAGCGIVADSVPEEELAESRAKLIPVIDALRA